MFTDICLFPSSPHQSFHFPPQTAINSQMETKAFFSRLGFSIRAAAKTHEHNTETGVEMRGAEGAENRRVTLEEAPTPLCCNPLHPARPRNSTREGGGFLYSYGD